LDINYKPNIFVVDDDPDILDLLRYNLTREDFRVSTANDGQEALDRVVEVNPDLILLDLMMPKVGGLDVTRKLQSNPRTKSIPIIMVTAKGEDSDIVVGLELGATDYIVKPFSMRVLIARIRKTLRRPLTDEPTPTRKSIQGLEIIPDRFEALVNGVEVGLTITEFRIMDLLSGHPGRVFTRGGIVNAVRGENYSVTDRSVDVHITSLRKKLGQVGAAIETVRGVGYRVKI